MAKRPFRPPFPWIRFLSAITFLLGTGTLVYGCMMYMPGRSATVPLPPLSPRETSAAERLRVDLHALAGDIGERNLVHPEALERAAQLIEERLRAAGHVPVRRTYAVDGAPCSNIEIVIPGNTSDLVVVGAHYDSARGSPGANDNGTGVVALLELARRLHGSSPERTLALVFFVNEEPPYFNTERMGSRVWASEAAQRGASIVAALSLETMGYFTEEPSSQRYPFPMASFYPDHGDFIGFVANIDSRALVHDVVGSFREVATIPSEGVALPDHTVGVDWSDHASFWRQGWPGLMITDTAPNRYPYYHTRNDTPANVDIGGLARVVVGVEHAVRALARIR
jgi:Zn-dependent M28 family amino/carboxypeptidase